MPLDPNIILSGRLPQIDSPLQVASQAMSLGQIARKNRAEDQAMAQEQALKDIYKKNVVIDENGNATLNRQGLMSDLYKANPQKAIATQNEFSTSDLAEMKNKAEMGKQLAWSIRDQASYDAARAKARELGLPGVDKMPPMFDPNYVRQMQVSSLSATEQINKMQQDRNYAMDQSKFALDKQKYASDQKWKADDSRLGYAKFGLDREKFLSDAEMRARGMDQKDVDLARQDRELALKDLKAKALGNKTNQQVVKKQNEFASRYQNILGVIDKLDKMVEDKGTYELFGSHNAKLSQAIDSIAIDSAKMFDPESVARESEVKAFKDMLFEPTATGMRNATARDILKNYKSMLEDRALREANIQENESFSKKLFTGNMNKEIKNYVANNPDEARQAAIKELQRRSQQAGR